MTPNFAGNIYQLYNPGAEMHLQVQRTVAEEDSSAVKCSLMERGMRSKNPW